MWPVAELRLNWIARGAAAALATLLLCAAAQAQSTPQRPAAGAQTRPYDARPERNPDGRRHFARRTGAQEDGPALEGPFAALPLRPTADDRAPLAEGEDVELLAFADEQIHPLYEALNRLRQGRPRAFQERMEQVAPYLRFLRRVHQENPQLGRRLIEHVKNNQFLERVAREWRRRAAAPDGQPVDPAERRRLAQEARQRAGQNLRIEVGILESQARRLDESRSQWIDDRVAALLAADDVALAAEGDELAAGVRALRAATDESARAAAEQALRARLDAQVSDDVAALRARADDLRQNAPAEISRRVRRVFGLPPEAPEPAGAPARP